MNGVSRRQDSRAWGVGGIGCQPLCRWGGVLVGALLWSAPRDTPWWTRLALRISLSGSVGLDGCAGSIDAVSVALNTADPRQYHELMTPECSGREALDAVAQFVQRWPLLPHGMSRRAEAGDHGPRSMPSPVPGLRYTAHVIRGDREPAKVTGRQ